MISERVWALKQWAAAEAELVRYRSAISETVTAKLEGLFDWPWFFRMLDAKGIDHPLNEGRAQPEDTEES